MFIRRIALIAATMVAGVVMADSKPASSTATQPVLRSVEQIDRQAQREADAAQKAYQAELVAVRERRIERLKRARDLAYADRDARLWARLDGLLEDEKAISATQPGAATMPADGQGQHIVFIADCTGSMFGTQAFKAQQAFLREQIEDLPPSAKFALAVMGGNVDPAKPAYMTADDAGKRRAAEAIVGMQAKGQVAILTVLSEALKLRPTTVWIVYQMPDTMEKTEAIVKLVETARGAANPPTIDVVCVARAYEADAKAIATAGGGTMVLRVDE